MEYRIEDAIPVLERTPKALDVLLRDLPEVWTHQNEGPETWSPFDIVGHLAHGEKTDWIARVEMVLSDAEDKTFVPFDRFAQERDSVGKSMNQLLDEFTTLRTRNLEILKSKNITTDDLHKVGVHPALGIVSLSNLLSTWVAHDLGHIAQINRVMAKQYKEEIGPWKEYIRIVQL